MKALLILVIAGGIVKVHTEPVFENAELGRQIDKPSFEQREPELRERLLDAQSRLAEAGFSLVVVVAGAEGAGKGDMVNRLMSWLDARGVETHALGEPSEEEVERPEYFRFWRRLPARGRTGIFFGSWYTRPITQHSLKQLDEAGMEDSLRRIVEFEQMLESEGVGSLVLRYSRAWCRAWKSSFPNREKQRGPGSLEPGPPGWGLHLGVLSRLDGLSGRI